MSAADVRALHRPVAFEGVEWECAEGDCEHDTCPKVEGEYCAHCTELVEDLHMVDGGEAYPILYPCDTMAALDPTPEVSGS